MTNNVISPFVLVTVIISFGFPGSQAPKAQVTPLMVNAQVDRRQRTDRQDIVSLPATPAGQQLQNLLAVLASESGAEVEAFIKTSFAPSFLDKKTLREQMKTFEQLHDDYGSLSVSVIEASEPNAITAILVGKNSSPKVRVHVRTEATPPNAINDLSFERNVTSAANGPRGIIERADSLFEAGKFDEAEMAYRNAYRDDPKSSQAAFGLGQIALFSNRLDEAGKYLRKANELNSDLKKAKYSLGEVFHRRDNFREAAKWFRAGGDEEMAKLLESFKEAPYKIEGSKPIATLKFVATDPLPIVQVKVNDSEPLNFLIDTGGAEVMLDSELAKRMKVETVFSGTGTFAGGRQAEVHHGRLDALTLGDFVVKNIPVAFRDEPTPKFAGRNIQGVLGTVLLYHFLSTIDYPAGQLILRRKSDKTIKQWERQARQAKQIVVRFWIADDHFIVARGSVNKGPSVMLLVDTGFAGGGFLGPDSTLKEAGIKLQEGPTPAGRFRFVVDELALGDAHERNIRGVTGVFPSSTGDSHGFHIAGLISHQFFKPYAVTFDFSGMKLFLAKA